MTRLCSQLNLRLFVERPADQPIFILEVRDVDAELAFIEVGDCLLGARAWTGRRKSEEEGAAFP